MPLTIDKRTEDNVGILHLSGQLTSVPSLSSLRSVVKDLLADPKLAGIILDVHQISTVDSSGLGELTIVYSSVGRRKCVMRLVGVSTNLKKMLEVTHLDGVLLTAADIPTAKRQVLSR